MVLLSLNVSMALWMSERKGEKRERKRAEVGKSKEDGAQVFNEKDADGISTTFHRTGHKNENVI